MVFIKRIKRIIEKYKRILDLENWQITVDLADEEFLQSLIKTTSPIYGASFISEEDNLARIYIWNNADLNTDNISIEAIVVHEMVHIILKPIDRIISLIATKRIKNLDAEVEFYIEEIVNKITRIALKKGGDSYIQKKDILLTIFNSEKQKNKKKNKNKR